MCEHASMSSAALVLLFWLVALPCTLKCFVDAISTTPVFRRRTDAPDRSAVRGSQLLDADGFFRRDFK